MHAQYADIYEQIVAWNAENQKFMQHFLALPVDNSVNSVNNSFDGWAGNAYFDGKTDGILQDVIINAWL